MESASSGIAGWIGPTSAFIVSVILLLFGGLIAGSVIPIDESLKRSVSLTLLSFGGIVLVMFLFLTYSKTSGIALATTSDESVFSTFARLFPPVTGSITNGFRILYYFLPYVIFMFGFFVDIVSAKVQFLPAGLTALITCIVNYFASTAAYQSFTTDRDMCGIPGLSSLGSRLLPQSALFNLTALAHIAHYITIRQGFFGVNKIVPAWGLFGAVAILQGFVLSATGCFESTGVGIGKILLTAGVAAGAGYVGAYMTSRMVSIDGTGTQPLLGPGGTQMCPDGRPPGPDGQCGTYSPLSQTCSAVGDDQFVCEAYKNGQLVTSTIAE